MPATKTGACAVRGCDGSARCLTAHATTAAQFAPELATIIAKKQESLVSIDPARCGRRRGGIAHDPRRARRRNSAKARRKTTAHPCVTQTTSQRTMSKDDHQKGSTQGKGLRSPDPLAFDKCLFSSRKVMLVGDILFISITLLVAEHSNLREGP